MSTVRIDPDHLTALAADLRRYDGQVTDLLARARILEAGADVATLTGVPAWAAAAARDVAGRVELLRLTDRTLLGGLDRLGVEPRGLAGSSRPIAASLADVALAWPLPPVDGPRDLSRRSNESLEDWSLRLVSEEAARYSHLPLAPQIAEALDLYGSYGDVLASWAMSSAAAVRLAKYAASGPMLSVLDSAWAGATIPHRAATLLRFFPTRWNTLTAPGFTPGLLGGQAITRIIAMEGISNPALARLATYSGNVFGRPWLHPLTPTTLAPTARNATNLVRVFQNPLTHRGLGPLASATHTAGALRSLGVVGGVVSTGFDIANVAAQGNPLEAFEREGAGYVADLAKTGFDASLTAALIAPNPLTWGAVGVTGAIWAGAEIVDHWDDVSAAADTAVDWADDRLDDAAGAIGDVAGGAIDAVKSSPVNPGNWF